MGAKSSSKPLGWHQELLDKEKWREDKHILGRFQKVLLFLSIYNKVVWKNWPQKMHYKGNLAASLSLFSVGSHGELRLP